MAEVEPWTWLAEGVSVEAATPPEENLFFGFHDVTPWSDDDRGLLLLRLEPDADAMPHSDGEAEVVLWDSQRGTIETLARTRCWNFQQAARQQWLPGPSRSFCYNRLDANGDLVAAIQDCKTGHEMELPGGLYVFANEGNWALSPDFPVLSKRWPAYGYRSLADDRNDPADDAHGIWRTDLASGKRELLVSLAQVLENWDRPDDANGHFLAHPSISPGSENIVFLHRFFAADGGSFTRLMVCKADGTALRELAAEKVSHFDWLADDELLAWARFAGSGLARARASGRLNAPLLRPLLATARRFTGRWKKRLLAEAWYRIGIDGRRERFGWPQMDVDGHPMASRRHRWIVSDTYPDSRGELSLYLCDRQGTQRHELARFSDGVATADSDAKCDLHPRWDRSGRRIAVDVAQDGRRRVVVLDIGACLDSLT